MHFDCMHSGHSPFLPEIKYKMSILFYCKSFDMTVYFLDLFNLWGMYFLNLYKLNFEYLLRVARALDTVTTTCLCPFLRCCFKPRAKSRKKSLHTFSSCNKYAKSSVKPSRVLLVCLLFNCRVAMAGGALRAKTLANSIQLLLSVLCHFCQLK